MQIPVGQPIDITESDLTGLMLKLHINERVKDTQKYRTQPLPDKLIMNKRQFKELAPDMVGYEGIRTRVYFTPYNAMEVTVLS